MMHAKRTALPAPPARRRRAFSLIEVMISSALFFVGLTAVFTCYRTASNLVEHNRNLTRAITLAEGTLEEMVQRYPGDPLLDVGDHTSDARFFNRDAVRVSTGGTYQVSWTIENYARLAGVREVTATVSWTEHGEAHTFSLTTWRL